MIAVWGRFQSFDILAQNYSNRLRAIFCRSDCSRLLRTVSCLQSNKSIGRKRCEKFVSSDPKTISSERRLLSTEKWRQKSRTYIEFLGIHSIKNHANSSLDTEAMNQIVGTNMEIKPFTSNWNMYSFYLYFISFILTSF